MNTILDLEEEFKTKRKEEEWEEEKNRVPRENKKQEKRTDGRNRMKRMGMQARGALAIKFIVEELEFI